MRLEVTRQGINVRFNLEDLLGGKDVFCFPLHRSWMIRISLKRLTYLLLFSHLSIFLLDGWSRYGSAQGHSFHCWVVGEMMEDFKIVDGSFHIRRISGLGVYWGKGESHKFSKKHENLLYPLGCYYCYLKSH